MDDNAMIDQLSGSLQPVRRPLSPILRLIVWGAGALMYLVVIAVLIGLRSDLSSIVHNPHFVFEVSLLLGIGLSAAYSSFLLCTPDMRGQGAFRFAPLVLLLTFALWEGSKILSGFEPFHTPHVFLYDCTISSLLFFSAPAAAMTLITLHKHATTHPVWLSAMNSLSVGGLGYIGLRLTCTLDDLPHDLFYHILPFIVLGTALAGIAKRFYRW